MLLYYLVFLALLNLLFFDYYYLFLNLYLYLHLYYLLCILGIMNLIVFVKFHYLNFENFNINKKKYEIEITNIFSQ